MFSDIFDEGDYLFTDLPTLHCCMTGSQASSKVFSYLFLDLGYFMELLSSLNGSFDQDSDEKVGPPCFFSEESVRYTINFILDSTHSNPSLVNHYHSIMDSIVFVKYFRNALDSTAFGNHYLGASASTAFVNHSQDALASIAFIYHFQGESDFNTLINYYQGASAPSATFVNCNLGVLHSTAFAIHFH